MNLTTKSLVSFGTVKLTSAAFPRSAVKSAESARIPRGLRADGLMSAVTPLHDDCITLLSELKKIRQKIFLRLWGLFFHQINALIQIGFSEAKMYVSMSQRRTVS